MSPKLQKQYATNGKAAVIRHCLQMDLDEKTLLRKMPHQCSDSITSPAPGLSQKSLFRSAPLAAFTAVVD